MKKTISLTLVLALCMVAKVTKADFTFGEATNLGPTVNSAQGDYDPHLSHDSLSLYFSSHRPGGRGSDDLYVTTRESVTDPWGPPTNLGQVVNSTSYEIDPSLSIDGLSLYFVSARSGGSGSEDLWVATRATKESLWENPVNLGSIVNTSYGDMDPSLTANDLELYFSSDRPGGSGNHDIWLTTKRTSERNPEGYWDTPINLGSIVNSNIGEFSPSISADGLVLVFCRGTFYGRGDLWAVKRKSKDDSWGQPVNLGPIVNIMNSNIDPDVSSDGRWLFWNSSDQPGNMASWDLWQAPIIPIVDLNYDGIVDSGDMCIMVDHWGENYSLCDIGPMPWGDGIVDVQDLIVLAEHLFEEFPPVEPVEVNEDNDGGQVELEVGQILVVTLESNPSTGYRWEKAEDNDSILEQLGEAEFKPSDTSEPPLVGAGGWEIFRFKVASVGQMTLTLVYHRPWEDVEPLKTFTVQVIVR